jgi:ketosteroid isomerase-like protein
MATATRSDVQVAERFVDALARGDWDAIEGLLAPDVRLRALVPAALREEEGREAVVGRFRFWWAGIEGLRALDSGIEPMANQVRVHYRLAGTDPDDGPVVVEQQCYFTVADGSIAKINSVCSGFQPADS